MKYVLLIAIFLFHVKPTFAIGTDKYAHAGVFGVAQTVCAATATKLTGEKTWSNVGCFLGLNTLGGIKELTDPSRDSHRELGDIGANVLGSGISFTAIQIGF